VFSARGRDSDPIDEERARLRGLTSLIFLDRPTRKVALVSAVLAALRARRRQYEVRDLLQQLQQAVRHRDQFLAMLGHELRNPLGAILASVQLMEQKEPATTPRERRIIRRQTQLLSRLVDDLLDVSRVTSGKIALDRASVDLKELVARCVVNHGGTAKEGGIALSFSTNGAVWVTGDAVRLEQVVNNLLTNALKYTPPGGRAAVQVRREGPDAVVSVADTGVGMDAEILPRVFDLFTQGENALDRAHGGLGIGLTLVRSLVELHGGAVSAESPGRGQGSTFTVRLPAPAVLRRRRSGPFRSSSRGAFFWSRTIPTSARASGSSSRRPDTRWRRPPTASRGFRSRGPCARTSRSWTSACPVSTVTASRTTCDRPSARAFFSSR
jgi:signal transduction histidine kinase